MLVIAGFCTSCGSAKSTDQSINIVQIKHVTEISDAYAVIESYEIINLKKRKFLVMTAEYFDNSGSLDSVLIWKSEGYYKITAKELNSDTSMKAQFHDNIKARLIDNRYIKINNDTLKIIGRGAEKNVVFGVFDNEKDEIYVVKYIEK
jgi:hypothetical protein